MFVGIDAASFYDQMTRHAQVDDQCVTAFQPQQHIFATTPKVHKTLADYLAFKNARFRRGNRARPKHLCGNHPAAT